MGNLALYCDGGVIGVNPSSVGGTWAWTLVHNDASLCCDYGVVTPADLWGDPDDPRGVSNNSTEMLAILEGLENAEPIQRRRHILVCSDSRCALLRLTRETKMTGVPPRLAKRLARVKERFRCETELLAGHPTMAELGRGVRLRNGLRASLWQQWCHNKCTRLAEEFKKKGR